MAGHAPPCPHCDEPVAYDEAENDQCPHCWGDIAWSQPFGTMGSGGLKLAKDRRGRWAARTDYCAYCRRDFPYNSLDEGDGLMICRECRTGRGRAAVARARRRRNQR